MPVTHEEAVRAAEDLLATADEHGVTLRLLGGLAIRTRIDPIHPQLMREYKDLDVIARPADSEKVTEIMKELGYQGDEQFNTLNAGRRGYYAKPELGLEIDVFMGDFEMCHTIPLMDRLTVDPLSIPLAELLLTKLQVVELNHRDEVDILQILLASELGDRDGDMINIDVVASLCATDWGLWKTANLNLERAAERIGEYGLSEAEQQELLDKIEALKGRLDEEPKSLKWRMRAKVGEKKRWYELPEER